MTVLIKRYANRKLYNTDTSRYITLKGIAELVEQGEDVRVIDNETGEDISGVTLSQILVDNERRDHAVPRTLLSDLIASQLGLRASIDANRAAVAAELELRARDHRRHGCLELTLLVLNAIAFVGFGSATRSSSSWPCSRWYSCHDVGIGTFALTRARSSALSHSPSSSTM